MRRTGYDRKRGRDVRDGGFCFADILLVGFTGGLWLLFMIDWGTPIGGYDREEKKLLKKWEREAKKEAWEAMGDEERTLVIKDRVEMYLIFVIIGIVITIVAYHAHI